MHIEPNWRILTIGDGDLSFSASLVKHHKPKQLTATVFDSYQTLADKYGDEYYQQLQQLGCRVLTGFDVTKPPSWSSLTRHQYDLVIFQFPLLPAFASLADFSQECRKNISVNTLNRRLLRSFLVNSFNAFLDPDGAGLCFITSKDVKPYREWNIEHALTAGLETSDTPVNYLGSMPFNIDNFPGYKIRNVDRDKHVKDTRGITYVWGKGNTSELDDILTIAPYSNPDKGDQYCAFCRVGPFFSANTRLEHLKSKRHVKMAEFEHQWLAQINVTDQ